ncbi:inositol monophosphatase family protein [Pararhodospirillum oryzae]|uniref:Inositol phosphatase n=1 Tax=Pararhodospirillum oryzae TaxID=478448 RepID=A0A512H397_9PROT|nr:inositol monophosphatase family protein [Pararhodospirillum oryzae]GEO79927.1 inositol phosphatase [Pararhodospirillum oryzae]
MLRLDPDRVSALIREVVDAEVLPRFRHLGPDDIHTKTSPTDLVTEADLQAEAVLTRRLADLLPGSRVVGEEAIHADPAGLDVLDGSDPVWIIDPVDGTGNFTRGNPLFACIVALAWRGETVMGWIDHCVERRTVRAERGAGVRSGTDPTPVRLAESTPSRLADSAPSRLAESMPSRLATLRGQGGGRPVLAALAPHVARIDRTGSAAHTYLSLLAGRADFAVFTRLKVWDHAAGVLMYREAGGVARLVSGETYVPTWRAGMPLMAPDDATWQALAALIPAPLRVPAART